MGDSLRRRRAFAWALMLVAIVPLAFGCWRFYVWRCGQPGEYIRYDPSPLLAEWERADEQYKALNEKAVLDNPQRRVDEENVRRKLKLVHERLIQDQEFRLAEARRLEVRLGVSGILLGLVLFGMGYRRLDKLPTVG